MLRSLVYQIKKTDTLNFIFINLLISIISIFTFIFLSNFFNKEDFGLYRLLVSILGTLYIFNLSGFDIFISRQFLQKDKEYFIYVMRKVMPLSLLAMIIIGVGCFIYFEKYRFIISVALMIASFQIFDKYFLYLEINQKFKTIRYLDAFNKISIFLVAIFAIYFSFSICNLPVKVSFSVVSYKINVLNFFKKFYLFENLI